MIYSAFNKQLPQLVNRGTLVSNPCSCWLAEALSRDHFYSFFWFLCFDKMETDS